MPKTLKHPVKDYVWAVVSCACAYWAYTQHHHLAALMLAFGGGYNLSDGFHQSQAYLQREIARIQGTL
jgi:hypothetical protein